MTCRFQAHILIIAALVCVAGPSWGGFAIEGVAPSQPVSVPSLSALAQKPPPMPPSATFDEPVNLSADASNPPAPVMDMTPDTGMQMSSVAPIDDLPRDPALPMADVPPVPVHMAPMVQTFTAQKGEDLFSVLQRFAGRAGQPMTYATAAEARLAGDFTFTGTVEEAIDALLQANPQAGLSRQSSL